MSRRRYVYRVLKLDGGDWIPVRHYQGSTAAWHRAYSLATATPGQRYRVERSEPVEFDTERAVHTEAYCPPSGAAS
jgi:hypothetical protein